MAKKRGRELGIVVEEAKAPEDDLYITPEHLKVCSCSRPCRALFLISLFGFLTCCCWPG